MLRTSTISPAELCLPESSFSLCSFRPAEAEEFFCGCPSSLRASGGLYTTKGDARGRPGWPHHLVPRPRGDPRQGVVCSPCDPSPLIFLASFVFWKNKN